MLAGALLLGLTGAAAQAAPIRFQFEGIVATASGIWAAQGTTVSGYYEMDSDAVDMLMDNDGHDAFMPDVEGNSGLNFMLSVTVGAITRSTETNRRREGDRHHMVQVFDRPADDTFEFTAFRRTPADDFGQLSFRDRRVGSTDPDGIAEGSFGLANAPLTSALDVALFQVSRGTYQAWHDGAVCIEGYVDFEVTSLEVVPEPGTGTLVGVGLIFVIVASRSRRLQPRAY